VAKLGDGEAPSSRPRNVSRMNSIRRHLSYANIVATLALVFAMSGSALAAKHYLINSTKQINPKVLKKLKGNVGKTGAKGLAGTPGATGSPGPEGHVGGTGPAGEAQAFATITPGKPAEISPGSRGVVSAITSGGATCVFLDPSIDLDTITAIVSATAGTAVYWTDPNGCIVGGKVGLEVFGHNLNGSINETDTFSIIVP
jgi:hypothetical protein